MRPRPLVLFCCLLLLTGCANIVPPSGGEKDLTEPVLISLSPPDSSLNKRVSEITIRFNKYMEVKDLDKNFHMAPMLPIQPSIISYGKRVEIRLIDSLLEENTTYQLDLGDALVDNREATPYKNFVYTFSTGSYFDSLRIRGRIFDAATGMPDTTAAIFLYPIDAADSALLRERPMYIQQVDNSGFFAIDILPAKPFRVYAIHDDDDNLVYAPGTDKIDFLDAPYQPGTSDSSLSFFIFKESLSDSLLTQPAEEESTGSGGLSARRKQKTSARSGNDFGYRVLADSTTLSRGTHELTSPLVIELQTPLSELDSSKVYLSYDDNGIEVEAVRQLSTDSFGLSIRTEWQPDKLYTLRLVKGWAKDSTGAELLPTKFPFRTKRLADYSTLKISIDSSYINAGCILKLTNDADTAATSKYPVTTTSLHIPLLPPGSYRLLLIFDENNNGRWDAGDLFKKRHAEKVLPYSGAVILKPGWENEITVVPEKMHLPVSSGGIRDRKKTRDNQAADTQPPESE